MSNKQWLLTSVLSLSLQVKAAFTRAYNKEVHLTPYSLQAVKKGRRGGGGGESELGGEDVDNEVQSEDEGDGLKADAMIKVRAFNLWQANPNQRQLLYLSLFTSCLCSVYSLQQKKAKQPKKEKTEDSGKGKGKGKGKAKKWPEEENKLSLSASDCPNRL